MYIYIYTHTRSFLHLFRGSSHPGTCLVSFRQSENDAGSPVTRITVVQSIVKV